MRSGSPLVRTNDHCGENVATVSNDFNCCWYSSASGAESCAHGDFALPRRGARELQIGHVGARNQQDEADCAQQRQQRWARLAGDFFVQRDQRGADALVGVWELRRQARGQSVHFRACLFERDAGLQPPPHHHHAELAALRGARVLRQLFSANDRAQPWIPRRNHS